MIIEIISVIILILMVTISFRYYNKNNKEIISFKETLDLTSLPIITLQNNGKKFNFLVDTGSTSSHINKVLITNNILDYKELSNNSGEKAVVMGMEGSERLVTKINMDLQLTKDSNKYNEDFLVNDLSVPFSAIKNETGATLHGILGVSFFDKYKYIIDFKKLAAYR